MSIGKAVFILPVALPALAQTADSLAPADNTHLPPPQGRSKLDLAKAHFTIGVGYYLEKKYGAALEEFQKSYKLVSIVDIQYNIGLSYEKLGRYDEAIAAFKLFGEAKPDQAQQVEAQARIAWIQNDLLAHRKKKERVSAAAQAKRQTMPPRPETLYTPLDKTWQMNDPENPSDVFAPVSTAAAGVVTGPLRPARPYRTLMWTSFGLSSAGLALGLSSYLIAKKKQTNHEEEVDRWMASRTIIEDSDGNLRFRDQRGADRIAPGLNELETEKNQHQTIAITGFVGSALFLALGGIFYWFDSERIRLAASPQAGGGHARLDWSW